METSVLGLENELAFGVRDAALRPQLGPLAAKLIQTLQSETPCLPCREGNVPTPGVMLGNGGRIYVDVGNFIENATPEVLRPEEVLTFQRAGELLLLRALPKAEQAIGLSPGTVSLSRTTTDYAGQFCGTHVNVMARRHATSDLVANLLPFLVTRFYAGAGGWSPAGFVMTQKASAIRCAASLDTRENRGLVNLKNEPLAKGQFKRIHLTSGDATMSDWSTYLTVACSALVVKMLDAGVSIGPAMTLDDPVAALRQLDTDPTQTRKLQLKCGIEISALEIQEHYLRAAEAFTQHSCEEWMKKAVTRWRETLDQLKRNPLLLCDKLDNYIKLKLFSQLLGKRGMTLGEFGRWAGSIFLLQPLLMPGGSVTGALPRRGLREFLRERLPFVPFLLLSDRLDKHRLSWRGLPRALALWREMLAVDLAYHDVSPLGMYFRLRQTGAVNSRLTNDGDIQRAMTGPPVGTRAQARSKAIHELFRGEKGTANWLLVASAKRSWDLSNPFLTEVASKPLSPPGKRR